MLKKCLSLALVALLVNLASPAPAFAKSKAEKEAQFSEKVKAAVLKLGVGPEAHVKVKLRDKTKLEGFISQSGEDSFTVTNVNTGVAAVVAYPQVGTVKGHNLSTGAKIAIIGLGVAVAVLAFFLWLENAD